ncbi:MAG: hypothetical protein IJ600_12285 [Lachnospiraceae bacterium]|nr:hypothetical protein [Lachnospiraceae bacterium]
MSGKNNEHGKAVIYAQEYVKALAGAAGDLTQRLEGLAGADKSVEYSRIVQSVSALSRLGVDNTPWEVRQTLSELENTTESYLKNAPETENEMGLFAKGLNYFAKDQAKTYQKCLRGELDLTHPMSAQEHGARIKMSFDSLQDGVRSNVNDNVRKGIEARKAAAEMSQAAPRAAGKVK